MAWALVFSKRRCLDFSFSFLRSLSQLENFFTFLYFSFVLASSGYANFGWFDTFCIGVLFKGVDLTEVRRLGSLSPITIGYHNHSLSTLIVYF